MVKVRKQYKTSYDYAREFPPKGLQYTGYGEWRTIPSKWWEFGVGVFVASIYHLPKIYTNRKWQERIVDWAEAASKLFPNEDFEIVVSHDDKYEFEGLPQ